MVVGGGAAGPCMEDQCSRGGATREKGCGRDEQLFCSPQARLLLLCGS